MNITAFKKNDSYIITLTDLNPLRFRSHKELIEGIGQGGSPHSDYVSRRRAFNRGSAVLYCNKDKLTTFVTLTYAKQHSDYQMILDDLKNVFSRKRISYLAVVEKHKSGFYHVHAITSDLEHIVSLRKGKYSWADWHKGFSDVKFLSGTDEKFRVERYVFKYMTKAEKIGGRYFLKSRDLTVKRFSYPFGLIPRPMVEDRPIDLSTYNIYTGNDYSVTVERRYYERRHSTEKHNRQGGQTRQGEL